jgi:2-polyprenyl-3-methyl-5-hydroxy-6-metoxy-1,4-benzoquinol methylase
MSDAQSRKTINYRDRFYRHYVSTHAASIHGEQSKAVIGRQFSTWRSYFGKYLPRDVNAKILDVGCGDGGFVYWLNSEGYKDVQGIDFSHEQIEVARSYGIENVKQADALEFLPEHLGQFDVIVTSDVLEHIPKESILHFIEMVRLGLKPGGVFIAQTVNAENLLWGRLRHGDFTHETAFTRTSIKQVASLAGFRLIGIYPQRPVIHGLKSLVRYCLWRSFELVFQFYLAVSTGSPDGIFTQNLILVARKDIEGIHE